MFPYPNPSDSNPLDWVEIDALMNTSSGTDCTGLMPKAAVTDEEVENYNELYDFLPNAVSDGANEGG